MREKFNRGKFHKHSWKTGPLVIIILNSVTPKLMRGFFCEICTKGSYMFRQGVIQFWRMPMSMLIILRPP